MLRPEYRAQADLLLSVLPHVAGEDLLALKVLNVIFRHS